MSTQRYFYGSDVATHELSTGAQLFLFSVREWKMSVRFSYNFGPKLVGMYNRFSVGAAIPTLDELMHQLAITAIRPPKIYCQCKTKISADELSLVNSMIALQKEDLPSATECMEKLVTGNFARTFHRIGQAYVDELSSKELSLSGLGRLRLVKTTSDASMYSRAQKVH